MQMSSCCLEVCSEVALRTRAVTQQMGAPTAAGQEAGTGSSGKGLSATEGKGRDGREGRALQESSEPAGGI